MRATTALPSVRESVAELESLSLAVEAATSTIELDGLLSKATALCGSLDALIADATGTPDELDDLHHWGRRGGHYLSLARARGVQQWSALTRRICVR